MQKKIRIIDLLYPHWGTLSLAFIAVLGESITDLLEPWPLKIVFDYVFGSKRMPDWLASSVSYLGTDKFSILNFAVLAVIVIAIFGAVSSYCEKYLTTSVGQWVMHDLRRVLYSHIQRLSLSYHDQKRTGDLISRVTTDIDAVQSMISQVMLGMLVNVLTLARHDRRDVLFELGVHGDRAAGRAGAFLRRLSLTHIASSMRRARCAGRKAKSFPFWKKCCLRSASSKHLRAKITNRSVSNAKAARASRRR